MNRRDLFKGVVAGAAAQAASAQQHAHVAPAAATSGAWKPLLFDAHQTATVVALTDLIIPRTDTPGAKDARVVEFIDLLLNDGPSEPRTQFLEGIGWLDGFALRRHQRPFVGCTAAQQVAMLKAIDQPLRPASPETLNRAGTPDRAAEIDRPVASVERPADPAAAEPDVSRGATFFRQVKMLTADGYYTSRIGIDELNKGSRVPGSFACGHQEGH
jgi:gluconate 2-dehydrogenase gamma chain